MDKRLETLNEQINSYPKDGDKAKLSKFHATRAELYFYRAGYEDCLNDSKKAIELDNSNFAAHELSGWGYLSTDNYDEALSVANTLVGFDALRGHNLRATVYGYMGNDIEALNDFNKAIELNRDSPDGYHNRAVYYHRAGNYDNALADYQEAIKMYESKVRSDPDFFRDAAFLWYRNLGDLYLYCLKSNYDLAIANYNKAKDLAITASNTYVHQRIIDSIKEAHAKLGEAIKPNEKVFKLMKRIEESKIEQGIEKIKDSFDSFITEETPLPTGKGFQLVVLRKWNSYTPIIAENRNISKGGGYFLEVDGRGIVIDPGFNFIDNFKSAGYKFKAIDDIIISHAHNDHVADLESILTLLHKYNENIIGDVSSKKENVIIKQAYEDVQKEILDMFPEDKRKENEEKILAMIEKEANVRARELLDESGRRKRIRIFMSVSTFKKYAPMLELKSSKDYSIVIIKSGEEIQLSPDETVKISTIKAKHDDMVSDCESMGFCIKYDKLLLLYTGDTGFSVEIGNEYEELVRKHSECDKVILLAHLGGFKDYENKFNPSKTVEENSKHFYKNHLGRLGLAKLVEAVKPGLCIISEFGEEFRITREKLAGIFNEVYGEDTFFIPGDVGMCVNAESQIKAITSVDWENDGTPKIVFGFCDYKDVGTYNREADSSLHYYTGGDSNKGKVGKYLLDKYKKDNNLSRE